MVYNISAVLLLKCMVYVAISHDKRFAILY
jgi:hypothetical protein